MKLNTWMWLALACGVSTAVLAADSGPDIYGGSLQSRVDALAAIQPGLGVVMHEVGYRFTNTYRAANGGNWGLAQYQLKELREALEVAEATRPQRAGMLQAFERAHLNPVGEAIEKKDLAAFNPRFAQAVKGCNACHTALGMHFIRYRIPEGTRPGGLDFTLKTDPEYHESEESK